MNTVGSRHLKARGFALFTSLMFLVILTALAAVVLKTSTNNERIAGGDLDRALAYQLAEATIRDAQLDIRNLRSTGAPCADVPPSCRPASDRPNKDAGMTEVSYVGRCALGRCYLGPGSDPAAPPGDSGTLYGRPGFVEPWNRPRLARDAAAREHAEYGQFTDPTYSPLPDGESENWKRIRANTGAAATPIYWVEVFPSGPTGFDKIFYRITVEASGRNPSTVVRLQEIYEPAL